MTIDYQSEMNNVLADSNAVPEWFYSLDSTTISSIITSALSNYTSATEEKNTTFLSYWNGLIAPYQP